MPKKIVNSVPTHKPPQHRECCYVDKDGKLSNQRLHDEIMEGVDDQDTVLWCREELKDVLTPAQLDVLYPLK